MKDISLGELLHPLLSGDSLISLPILPSEADCGKGNLFLWQYPDLLPGRLWNRGP